MDITKEMKTVFDMIMTVPGMKDVVKKNDFSMSMAAILLLCQLVEDSLGKEKDSSGLLALASPEIVEELKGAAELWLKNAELIELNNQLRSVGRR